MEAGLYTNRSVRRDFIDNALRIKCTTGTDVYIATAFFTDVSLIRYYIEHGCRVRLVIRLGFPTSPDALGELLKLERVEARYYTHNSFHPKLYIFGDDVALIGSANLTKSALLTNQEILLTVSPDDPRFDDLKALFDDYWNGAGVLNAKIMQGYRQKFERYKDALSAVESFDHSISGEFGDISFDNIDRSKAKRSTESTFLDSYGQSFQECTTAFADVRAAYRSVGSRKVTEEQLPERLEIDGFISWTKEVHAKGESWREPIVKASAERQNAIAVLVREWLNIHWKWFDETIVPVNYPRLKVLFRDDATLIGSNDDALFKALCSIHAFLETRRYHEGGTESLKRDFFSDNDGTKIRKSLSYLILGNDPVELRMANLIFNSDYKLQWFGRSSVQELVGWLNGSDIPVVNGRTTKVLHYFGFKVKQI